MTEAIPTTYAGVRFRSRLEARWAAFFDLLGFEWEYEPLDLAGYIPDFVVCRRLLVEVKPVLWTHDTADIESAARTRLERANAGRFHWIALLGAALPQREPGCIGETASADPWEPEEPWRWRNLTMAWWPSSHEFSLDAQPILRSTKWIDEPPPPGLWSEAGNRVQWRRPT
jgi:hypothetical protein